ncbi:MAG: M2 family metallopeptidase [bacterium JZ-2024 1]
MTEAQKFISVFESEMAPLLRANNLAYWKHSIEGTAETALDLKEKTLAVHRLCEDRERFLETRRLISQANHDETTARCLTLLDHTFTANQGDSELKKCLVELEVEITSILGEHRPILDGKVVTDNEIEKILRDARNENTRRQAWEASRSIGARVAPVLRELVRLRNEKARSLGFKNYYAMMMELQEIDLEWLMRTWESLNSETQRSYLALLGELMDATSSFLGRPVRTLYPWDVADPFFQRVPPWYLDNQTTTLQVDIVESAKQTYNDLGIPVDEILSRSDLFEKPGKHPHAYCINIDRCGDIRILANCVNDERWANTMLHELGHAVYDACISPQLPFTLRTPAHIATTEAVAILMGRLSRDPEWRAIYLGNIPPPDILTARFRRAESLIFLRWVLVMTFFEKALYEQPEQDLDELWWNLVEQYQGIQRPVSYPPDSWAAKIHLAESPVYYHNYLLGEIMSWQMEEYILKATNRKTLTRNDVGLELLRNRLFRNGALRTWADSLREALGQSFDTMPYLRVVGG